jgi:putative addiction module component (TIGR02574 family)
MGTQTVDFEQLSTAEKILRLQEQWDRIAENPDAVDVTEAQKLELDTRLAAMEESPGGATSWTKIKAELRAKR